MGFPKADLIDAAEFIIVAVMIILVVLLVLQPMVGKLMSVADADSRGGMDLALQHDLLAASPANPALAPPGAGSAPRIGADGQPIALPSGMDDDMPETMINVAGIEGRVKASAIKQVEEIVENYPAETVSVIRSWMAQEN